MSSWTTHQLKVSQFIQNRNRLTSDRHMGSDWMSWSTSASPAENSRKNDSMAQIKSGSRLRIWPSSNSATQIPLCRMHLITSSHWSCVSLVSAHKFPRFFMIAHKCKATVDFRGAFGRFRNHTGAQMNFFRDGIKDGIW